MRARRKHSRARWETCRCEDIPVLGRLPVVGKPFIFWDTRMSSKCMFILEFRGTNLVVLLFRVYPAGIIHTLQMLDSVRG